MSLSYDLELFIWKVKVISLTYVENIRKNLILQRDYRARAR